MDTKRDKISLEKNLQVKKVFLMKSILIAGGTGFIGFHFIKKMYKNELESNLYFVKKTKKKKKNQKSKLRNLQSYK